MAGHKDSTGRKWRRGWGEPVAVEPEPDVFHSLPRQVLLGVWLGSQRPLRVLALAPGALRPLLELAQTPGVIVHAVAAPERVADVEALFTERGQELPSDHVPVGATRSWCDGSLLVHLGSWRAFDVPEEARFDRFYDDGGFAGVGDHLGFIRKLTDLMVPSAVGLFADAASLIKQLALSKDKRADRQFKFGAAFVQATVCKPIVADKESEQAEALQALRKFFGTVAQPNKTFDVAVVPTGPDTQVYLAVALKSEEAHTHAEHAEPAAEA